MAFFSIKKSAWDQIKAAVADAAEAAGDKASDLRDAALDVHGRVHAQVKDTVGQGVDAVSGAAQYGVDSVRGGVSAVGRGVGAVGDGVGRTANGVVAGAIAGAFASWMMNQFQAVSAKPLADRQREAAQSGGTAKSAAADGENATVQVAQALVGHEIAPDQKATAGSGVHYGYGAAMGALYGGLSEVIPGVSIGLGIPYATLLWLFGDEIAVSALGLSKPPTQTTPAEHAASFSAHLVYGVSLDIARRVLRHIV